MNNSTNLRILRWVRSRGEKADKGEEIRRKSTVYQNSKIGGKMKRRNTKRKRKQPCDVAQAIDSIERAHDDVG